ncbi:hypothetical protein [Paenibacillus polymyxa]|uniref:hypothetical protein n=1 Tax=Paenibacillus polymyxa TaxID=1406 RepID=UPI002AB3B028|nr:hypothetical protein [Paenibacillus polymyxa]MDY8023372.1 hypothetical protein [Paenibacillus polymyxa]
MGKKKGGRRMSTIQKDKIKSSGFKQMKEIAKKAMANGNFTVDDVKNDLKKYREISYR